MDPRLLLDRKAMKKQLNSKGVSSRQVPEGTVIHSSSSKAPSSSDNSPSRSVGPVSPHPPSGALSHDVRDETRSAALDGKMDLRGSGSNGETLLEPSLSTNSVSSRNLLTAHYGVEDRTEPPRKKIKVAASASDVVDEPRKIGHAFHHSSNGIVGEYLRPNKVTHLTPEALHNAVVDLTTEDDSSLADNDMEITGSRNILDEEVCLGALHGWAQAHAVPKPKTKTLFETTGMWPLITCTLRRNSGSKSSRIDVVDLHGKEFASIDQETAVPLSQVMDGIRGIRTQPRIMPRKKIQGQWPHQETSERIPIRINLYAKRVDVQKLGLIFGQHNKWFQNPLSPDKNIPIVNPHAEKKAAQALAQHTKPRGNVLSDTRTLEEVTSAITKVFDHFAGQSGNLDETDGPSAIVTPLLSHQKQALTFMLKHERPRTFGEQEGENSSLWRKKVDRKYQVTYEDPVSGLRVDQEPEQVLGGLLADVMGLGKTLEALTLIASTVDVGKEFQQAKFVRNGEQEEDLVCASRGTLVICPTSTVQNWESQIKEHLAAGTLACTVYHGPNRIRNAYELAQHDIVVTTYGTITADHGKKLPAARGAPLKQIKWFRIILDEAHTIREQRTAQSEAVNKLWAQRRWCLTGTPIQNRIDDLGALTHFLRLYPYDNAARFNQYIRGPAQAGDPAFLFKLRIFVDSFTLRRLRDKINLPKRHDVVQDLQFSRQEEQMHEIFKKRARLEVQRLVSSKEQKSGVQHHVLQAIMTLRLICAHGRDLLKEKDLKVLKGFTETEPIDIDDEQAYRTIDKRAAYETLKLKAEADVDFCHQCDRRLCGDTPPADVDDTEKSARCYVLPCYDTVCADCFVPYVSSFWEETDAESHVDCPFCGLEIAAQCIPIRGSVSEMLDALPEEAAHDRAKGEDGKDMYGGPSTKTRALLRDIEFMTEESKSLVASGQQPLKCVVFSEFTSNLNLIGRDLAGRGYNFVRIDGSMSLSKRKQVLDALATEDSVTILLASIKAAGQGLNLTAASRAFIMEPMWNPAAEAQAVDRIYRIGQTREVIIKRYLIKDSIEMKIVELQQKKQQLADVTMSRNHKQLSKKEIREQHMKDIVKLFK